MRWADQTDRRLLDIEQDLAEDRNLRGGFTRSHRMMAVREFANRWRGWLVAGGVAAAVGLVVLLAGLLIGAHGTTGLAALLAGAILTGAVAYALVWAVLDHQASPPDRD